MIFFVFSSRPPVTTLPRPPALILHRAAARRVRPEARRALLLPPGAVRPEADPEEEEGRHSRSTSQSQSRGSGRNSTSCRRSTTSEFTTNLLKLKHLKKRNIIICAKLAVDYAVVEKPYYFRSRSLKLECEKLASEKIEIQRHYVMVNLAFLTEII